jgi:hypothetical protein
MAKMVCTTNYRLSAGDESKVASPVEVHAYGRRDG